MGKGRAPCCDKSKVKKGPWSPQEDFRLITFIQKHGHSNWRSLPNQAGLLRCGKSCRLRWINYLRPDLKRGNFTQEEEEAIIKLHKKFGNKWSKIASCFPGRTDNEIKNIWHTHLKKRLDTKGASINNHNDQTKEFSKSSSFSFSSSSSSSISITSPNRNQNIGNKIEEKNQRNDTLKENSSSSNSLTTIDCLSNPSLTEHDIMQIDQDTDFLIDYANQENYEILLNSDQDVGNFPVEIDYNFFEMLDKEVPIYTNQSHTKEFEIYHSNFEEIEREKECMRWMKNLENELLGGGDPNLSQDVWTQSILSP